VALAKSPPDVPRPPSCCDREVLEPRLRAIWDFLLTRVLVPPVIGVLCGIICSTLPPTYYLLCGGTFGEVLTLGTTCPATNAPFAFLTRGIAYLGNAAVPLNLILLGNSLSKGPDFDALSPKCNVGIVVAKMLVMPVVGVGTCVLLDRTLGDGGLGWIALQNPYDEVLYLAATAVTATPTANTLVLMTELAGGNKAAMSTSVFTQYMCAPLVLTASLTVAILVLHGNT